jgi:hypothetical protein
MNTDIRTALQKLVELGAKLNPFPRQHKVPWDDAFVESLVAWAQSEGTIEIYEDRARAVLSDWGDTPPTPGADVGATSLHPVEGDVLLEAFRQSSIQVAPPAMNDRMTPSNPWGHGFDIKRLADRLAELADYVTQGADCVRRNFEMHFPTDPYHDAGLVIGTASRLLMDGLVTPPAPKPVSGGFPDAPCQCPNCQSKDLEWGAYIQYITGDRGGYKTKSVFALACLDCSETVLIVDSDHVAVWMNNKGAAPAPTRDLSELNHLQLLERIAEIAHAGGLIGFEEQGKALREIRKLTKLFWGNNRQQQVVAHIDPVSKSADNKLLEVFYRACGRGLEVDPDMLVRGIRGVRAFRFTSRTSNLTSAEVQQIIEALDFCIGDSDYRANSGRHHVLRKRLKSMIGTL